MKPILLVIAGPNGAGKTTVTVRLRQDHWSADAEYINPDEIARDRFGDWNSPEAVGNAARWAADRREELLALRRSLAFETVFSTADKVDFVRRAADAGYFIRFFFVGTSDPTINAARVAARIMEGGHSVPIDKIISRYSRCLANLGAAIQLADRVYLYDNSVHGVEAQLIARTTEGSLRKVYGDVPAWIETAVRDLKRHERFEDQRTSPQSR